MFPDPSPSTAAVPWYATLLFVFLLVVHLALAVRIIMRRLAVGESLAWIMVMFLLPVGGVIIYLLIGELRLGNRRARRVVDLYEPIRAWLAQLQDRHLVDWSGLGIECPPLASLAELSIGLPALPGNRIRLIDSWQDAFRQIIADIDASQETCHLEFYIWHEGGEADRVADAMIRAAARGVTCRVLVDALGSRPFLRSATVRRMREAGVEIHDALPGGVLRLPFVRFDLRLHRKIVVIDGKVAYTGSLNLVDPRYFKQDAGVGQWVDAMARIEGPAVEALAITFLTDWYVETDSKLESLRETGNAFPQPKLGECAVQVIPSGPVYAIDAI
jgi:cardiolipin synthase